MASTFAFHPEAFQDLDLIRAWLAERNPDAADRFVSDFYRTIRTVLVAFPQAGHRRPDLTSRPLRFHVMSNQYLVAYAPDEHPLWIVAVIHAQRNPRIMAAILRGRE